MLGNPVRRFCRDFPTQLLTELLQVVALKPTANATTTAPATAAAVPKATTPGRRTFDGSSGNEKHSLSIFLSTLALYMLHPDLFVAWLQFDGTVPELVGTTSDACDRVFEDWEQDKAAYFHHLLQRRLCCFAVDKLTLPTDGGGGGGDHGDGAAAGAPRSPLRLKPVATPPFIREFVESSCFHSHILEEIAAPFEMPLVAARQNASFANAVGGLSRCVLCVSVLIAVSVSVLLMISMLPV